MTGILKPGKATIRLEFLAPVFSILAPTFFFLVFFHDIPLNSVYAGDAGIKYLQVVGLSASGGGPGSFPYPAESIDPEHRFLPAATVSYKGHIYGVFPYVFSIFSWPFWKLFGFGGIYFIPLIGVILSLFFTYLATKEATNAARGFAAMIILAGASPLTIYGILVWEHSIAAALVLISAWFWMRKDSSKMRIFFGGFFLGASVWFRPEAYSFIFGVGAAFAAMNRFKIRRLIPAALGGLAALAPFWALNIHLFNSPVGLQVTFNMPKGLIGTLASGTAPFSKMINLVYPVSSIPQAKWLIVFIVAVCFIGLTQRLVRPFINERIFLALGWLALLINLWFLRKGFHSVVSLAGTFPAILIFMTSHRYGEDGKPADSRTALFLSVGAAVSILTVLLTAPLTGGLQAGPRFLIPAIPLLCVALFSFLPKKVKANEIAAVSVAALLGFMMLTKGVVMVRNFQLENAEMVGFAETHVAAGEYILTDQNWFPQVAARSWLSRPMAVTQKELELKTAVERLGMINIRSFWLVQLLYPLTNSPDNAPISPETILSYSRKERLVYKMTKYPVVFSHYFIGRNEE